MVRIRLRRMGLRSKPTYRVVATDSRKARDSKYLEAVGSYDPRSKNLDLDLERVNYWLGRGAQPSETVSKLIQRKTRQQASAEPAAPAEPAVTAAAPEPVPAEPPAEPAPEPAAPAQGTD